MPSSLATRNGCARCGHVFWTLTDFDSHQDVRYGRRPPVLCLSPQYVRLEEWHGAWGTPAGNAQRAAGAWRLAGRRP